MRKLPSLTSLMLEPQPDIELEQNALSAGGVVGFTAPIGKRKLKKEQNTLMAMASLSDVWSANLEVEVDLDTEAPSYKKTKNKKKKDLSPNQQMMWSGEHKLPVLIPVKYSLLEACVPRKKVAKVICDKQIKPESVKVISDFIKFCQKYLDIKDFPVINLYAVKHENMTTGAYDMSTNVINCLVGKRLVVDVLRTLAHELVHRKQHERGDLQVQLAEIDPMDEMGDIDTDFENEAYTLAGNLVKIYCRKQKVLPKDELYSLNENKKPSTSVKYWHVTKQENLPFIRKNGLIAKKPLDYQDEPGVYLFKSKIDAEEALMNWLGDRFEEEDELVMLPVDKDAVRETVPGADYEIISRQNIAPGALGKPIKLDEQVRKPFHIDLPDDLLRLSKMFTTKGKKFLLVGGAVRDALMGKEPKDLDIATDALPDETIAILRQDPKNKILEVGKAFGVIMVITPEGNEYEIASLRKDLSGGRRPDAVEFTGIEDDAKRRDLTINALYYDLARKEVLDYVGGLEDIQKGLVRTVGSAEERFGEDRLRILRAIRFAGRLGTQLDPKTASAIAADNSLSGVSGERIRDEFLKGIKSAKNVPYFLGMISRFDLWSQIFPGLVIDSSPETTKDAKNIPVQLALLLKNNSPDVIARQLNKANYSSDEVKQVVFLRMFLDLQPDNAFRLKKLYKNARLTEDDLIEFAQMSNRPSLGLLRKFISYEPSVNAAELQKLGFTGKELGQEIERLEVERFKTLKGL